jgi:hypothetical protein
LRQRAAIKAKRDGLDSCKIDTPDHQRLALEIARAEAELQATVEVKEQLFRRQESRLYLEAYKDIIAAVEAFSREHEIVLVLAYNSDRVDQDVPGQIERAIRGHLVYHKSRNITYSILEAVNSDLTDEEKASRADPVFLRPVEDLRATGLKLPFHRTVERPPPFRFYNR